MNLIGIQIISIFFAFFMIYVTFLAWKKRDITGVNLIIWLIMWISFIIFAAFPHVLNFVIETVKIVRVMDLLMIVAFMILTFLGFQNYISNRKMEKQIEILVRKIAIKNVKEKK